VAAPILPGTPTADQAALLARLSDVPDADLRRLIEANPGIDAALDAAAALEPPLLRQLVVMKLRDNNVISGAYKHVDGTSFAAPIVSSIAAQMLEANPASPRGPAPDPTARRLPRRGGWQGWGVRRQERWRRRCGLGHLFGAGGCQGPGGEPAPCGAHDHGPAGIPGIRGRIDQGLVG
jgi:subtilisin family serine protease